MVNQLCAMPFWVGTHQENKKAAVTRGWGMVVGPVYFTSVRQNLSMRSKPFSMFARLVA
jgi:hypothetical protein